MKILKYIVIVLMFLSLIVLFEDNEALARRSSGRSSYRSSHKTSTRAKTVHVRGYTKKDGTRVSSHRRSAPRR